MCVLILNGKFFRLSFQLLVIGWGTEGKKRKKIAVKKLRAKPFFFSLAGLPNIFFFYGVGIFFCQKHFSEIKALKVAGRDEGNHR